MIVEDLGIDLIQANYYSNRKPQSRNIVGVNATIEIPEEIFVGLKT